DFAHHQRAIGAPAIRIDGDRFQHAIGAMALGLQSRAAVEAPQRKLLERRKCSEFLDLRFAAQVGRRRVSVEPDILELILGHLASHDAKLGTEAFRSPQAYPATNGHPVQSNKSAKLLGFAALTEAPNWLSGQPRLAELGC